MKVQNMKILLFPLSLCKIIAFTPATTIVNNPTLSSQDNRLNFHGELSATVSSNQNVNLKQDFKNTQLLDQALASKKESAQQLVDQLTEFRQTSNQEGFDNFLNDLLIYAEPKGENALPWWTRFRVAAKFSKRARRASLLRVIQLSSAQEEEEKNSDDAENVLSSQSRRRRSLLLLLRSLADNDTEDSSKNDKQSSSRTSIYKLEKIAIKEQKRRVSPEDILGRIPESLETPSYKVLKTNYTSSPLFYEIRQYDPFSTCTVKMNQPKKEPSSSSSSSSGQATGSAFGSLAGYLFGKNQSSKKMAMTTPVFISSPGNDENAGNDSTRQMSFVLPSEYWTQIENAPKPLETINDDGSNTSNGVILVQEDTQNRAVLIFGGFAGKKDVELQKRELLKMVEHDPDWMIENVESSESNGLVKQEVMLAQYNDPFTPPWKRRNEVSVLVVPKS